MVWQDTYARTRVTGWFGRKDPKFYSARGHPGMDFAAATGSAVPSWTAGTVTTVTRSIARGQWLEIKRPDGSYAAWAHVKNIAVKVGDQVRPGQTIAQVAGWGDNPGTAWNGPHIHADLSPQPIIVGLVNNARDARYDPWPAISAATAAERPGGTETPPEQPQQSAPTKGIHMQITHGVDDKRISLVVENGGQFHIPTPQIASLLTRYLAKSSETYLQIEIDMIKTALRAAWADGVGEDTQDIINVINALAQKLPSQ